MPYKRKYTPKSRTARKFSKAIGAKRWSAMRRKRLIRTIKAVTMKVCEPKCSRKSIPKFELYHNQTAILTLNTNSYMPSQGVGDTQRVGDQINLTGFRLRLLLGQKADRPNVTFRWWIVVAPKGSSYSYTNWFVPTTGNVLLDDLNKDFVKQLKTGLWRPNEAGLSGTGGDEYTFAKKIWLPYKKLLKFGPGDGLLSHNDNDVHFILASYDAYGTLETDNIAYCQMAVDIFYRDP